MRAAAAAARQRAAWLLVRHAHAQARGGVWREDGEEHSLMARLGRVILGQRAKAGAANEADEMQPKRGASERERVRAYL